MLLQEWLVMLLTLPAVKGQYHEMNRHIAAREIQTNMER